MQTNRPLRLAAAWSALTYLGPQSHPEPTKLSKYQDCGPGFGETDHYKLLHPSAFTGRAIPLCCENISAPILPAPAEAAGVDALARRAREFLEVVVRGLQA